MRGNRRPGHALSRVQYDTVMGKINELCAATISVMARWDLSVADTLPMLFDQATIDGATAAKGLIASGQSVVTYPIGPNKSPDLDIAGVSIIIDYSHETCAGISPAKLSMSSKSPFIGLIRQVRAIHMQFEEVKAVVRWLDCSGTLTAINYYWPTITALCPKVVFPKAGFRCPPIHLNCWLQPLRDSAATVVKAKLLPPTTTFSVPLMRISFSQQRVEQSGTAYTTDTKIYWL